MARKLTKAELERNKADFEIPVGLKTTKKEKAPKEGKEKKPAVSKKEPTPPKPKQEPEQKKKLVPKHPGGRPGAFREVQSLTLKLPPADITKLKVIAAQQNKTAAQIIHDLLN